LQGFYVYCAGFLGYAEKEIYIGPNLVNVFGVSYVYKHWRLLSQKGKFLERRIDKYFFTIFGVWLVGIVGDDRFLRGQIGLGILKLITFGALGVWYLVDLIIVLLKFGQYEKDFEFINGAWKQ
jgi:TM2 domain-containing membrane protein YozV